MVHPIRIDNSPDPLPRGPSIFIPFESFNIGKDGSSSSKIAIDLPPMKTIQHARLYIMNNRALATRAIDYREYSEAEAKKSPDIMKYLGLHKGAL